MMRLFRTLMRGFLDYRSKDISDDYTFWLSHANTGMMRPGNLLCFDYAIQNMPENLPILEIGSWAGLSANVITYYKRKYRRLNRLLTCDKWDFKPFIAGDSICEMPVSDYENFIKESFQHNVTAFSRDDLPFSIQMTSDELFQGWQTNQVVTDVFGRATQLGGSIGFAYIDGNHSFEFAQRDFMNCDLYLAVGGFVLFDDSGDYVEHESRLVAQGASRRKNYKIIKKNPNYLLQKTDK